MKNKCQKRYGDKESKLLHVLLYLLVDTNQWFSTTVYKISPLNEDSGDKLKTNTGTMVYMYLLYNIETIVKRLKCDTA